MATVMMHFKAQQLGPLVNATVCSQRSGRLIFMAATSAGGQRHEEFGWEGLESDGSWGGGVFPFLARVVREGLSETERSAKRLGWHERGFLGEGHSGK